MLDLCVEPEQEEACEFRPDERPCEFAGRSGVCRSGVCVDACGDGVLDAGEECDGNVPLEVACRDYGHDLGTLACSSSCRIQDDGCRQLGWQRASTGTVGTIVGVWGPDSQRLYAVTNEGALLERRDSVWHILYERLPGGLRPEALTGTDDGRLLIVGPGGPGLAFDGTQFAELPLFPGLLYRSIWSSGESIYAVGSDGSFGTIVHFDGIESTLSVVGDDIGGESLAGVWGSEDGDVFTVGSSGSIYRNDGRGWRRVANTGVELLDVEGSGPRDVYAVGSQGFVHHFNGEGWRSIGPVGIDSLNTVSVNRDGEVFVAGTEGSIFRFDGLAWTRMETNTSSEIGHLYDTSDGPVYASGRDGTMLRLDTYLVEEDLDVPGSLTDIWRATTGEMFAAGSGGLLLYFDGAVWRETASPTSSDLLGIWGTSPRSVVSVGGDGTALKYDGTTWRELETSVDSPLFDVWVSDERVAHIVGADGIFTFDGSDWLRVDGTKGVSLRAVWGSGSSVVHALGDGDRVFEFDDNRWSSYSFRAQFSDIWGTDAATVFATGSQQWRREGAVWRLMPLGDISISRISGTSGTDVFGVDETTLFHYGGTRWQRINEDRLPGGVSIEGVWATPEVVTFVGNRERTEDETSALILTLVRR